MHVRQAFHLLVTILLLAACTATPGTPITPLPVTLAPAVPSAAPEPTDAPLPTSLPAPTAETSATPLPETNPLPAPAYFNDTNGRIFQIAPDGSITTLIETGTNGIASFDINAQGGLIYSVVDENGSRLELIGADQTAPIILLSLAGQQISAPLWFDDGSRILVGIGGSGELAEALYMVAPTDGGTQLFEIVGKPDELLLTPLAFSPDGNGLVVGTTIPGADYCGQAVIALDTQTFTELQPPDGFYTDCYDATWTGDSTRILLTLQDTGAYAATQPGLYQADPQSGRITAFTSLNTEAGFMRMARISQLPDNQIGAFIAFTPTDAPPEPDTMWEYTMYAISADDATLTPFRDEQLLLIDAAWAPDGSGALVSVQATSAPDAPVELRWLPSDGSAAVVLGEVESAYGLRWGR
jgi:hypothetical protein